MTESIARTQVTTRVGAAREQRRGHQLARAHRLSRRAELAARDARTALARAL
ncbi:hypothetical protein [Nocardioides pantholopis]|nr:hypothetical protein [Nocardioides pantholopis]